MQYCFSKFLRRERGKEDVDGAIIQSLLTESCSLEGIQGLKMVNITGEICRSVLIGK